MAAISCNALGAVGVVASARAPVASRGAVAALPVRTQAKSVGFGSEAQRRGLAMNAARGRSTRGARGFEVVAQAISEPEATEAAPEASAGDDEAVCYLRGVHMSPYKVRRVLDVIRGKSYEECLIMLEFMPYRACEPVLNALFSAASNAKNNLGMNKAKLYVSETYADGTGTMKRFHPRAQGRPFPIRKRTCNITLKMKERP
uniref:Large ribosomal subunit protein uL22c n=1 Tax=Micromonas pusilla TaxID=38833 RepID=A0A7S0D6C1_MICPS|eukprot:CAMPEP_0203005404 /NCGR_PEP_ID=MMETSP1401-20130829/2937_1 /ASSEMBLY_ACC=CAM_ASM_000894 /TAXON_ID=38833 /ORGANISM="Micromonas pusilla, Strain CCAC1681" /LENGTH=201 /DNA_ID=CAMNT_0049747033 /DNA_START=53 /DNA_END=658 /DNA_ORIENTATION=-